MVAERVRPEFDALNSQIARLRAYVWRCHPESLADLIGVDPATIYRFRSGKLPSIDTLRRIALSKDFGTSPKSESQVGPDPVTPLHP